MIAPRLDLPPVGPSMVCAGCDGPMVITKDAIGRERLRCPWCHGVAKHVAHHPDDAMLPQGLVKSHGAPPRVVQQVVHVRVPAPAPPPEIITELPPIGECQVRCQLCARGIHPDSRFCASCALNGALILRAAKVSRQSKRGTNADRVYPNKRCAWLENGARCERVFTPTGPRSLYCPSCRVEAEKKAQHDAYERRMARGHA